MTNSQDQLFVYRRHLPHWRLSGSTYFVTWRLERRQPRLTEDERALVCSSIRHFESRRYELSAFVVMDDHVHVLFRPSEPDAEVGAGARMATIVQGWKSFTAHVIQQRRGRRGALWQRESFDRIIRSEHEFLEKANYILSNPFVRWPEIDSYRWMGTGLQGHDG
ncbi:MAG: transposase [Chloroflexota bacterium]|nr:transposase [Chloroflexota bacterium]